MSEINRKVLNDILAGRGTSRGDDFNAVIQKDQNLRKEIAELYQLLAEAGDSKAAIELLSEHVAIMVDMINEFKQTL